MAGSLVRWDPFGDMADFRGRFERLLDEIGQPREGTWAPAIDTIREEGAIVVRADVPGVKPEDIRIEVEGDVLTLSGSHEESKEDKDKDYVRRERRYGSFVRSMTLPQGADAEHIEATAKNGVLEVRVPVPEKPAPKTITITPNGGG